MSWDAVIMAFSRDWQNLDDIPSDWKPGSLGSRDAVIAAIRKVFPDAVEGRFGFEVLGDPAHISFSDDEPVVSISVSLQAGSSDRIRQIIEFADELGGKALDPQQGRFLVVDEGHESLAEWKAHRNALVGDSTSHPDALAPDTDLA